MASLPEDLEEDVDKMQSHLLAAGLDLDSVEGLDLANYGQSLANYGDMDESDDEDLDDNLTPPEHKAVLKAAEDGDIALLESLLDASPHLVNCCDMDGYTPMHRATYNGHLEVVKSLMARGANIRSKTNDGWEPLHSAAKWQHVNLVAFLIENGADINCVTKSGITPLHLAAETKTNRNLLELLIYHPDINLQLKAANGDTARDICMRSGPFEKLFDNVQV